MRMASLLLRAPCSFNDKEVHPCPRGLKKVLGPFQLWGIAVGLVISGEYFGWSYGWNTAGTLGFLVTTVLVATDVHDLHLQLHRADHRHPARGRARSPTRGAPSGPTGGFVAGFATLVEFVFAPPAIALAIGAYLNVQFPGINPKWFALGAYVDLHRRSTIGVGIAAAFELFVTRARDLRAAGVHGRGRAGLVDGELRRQRLGRRRRASAARRSPGIFAVDPVRDLVLPRDRRRGDGGRGGARSAPHHSARLHRPASSRWWCWPSA